MHDVTICIPSVEKDESAIYEIKQKAKCPVIVVRGKPYGEAIKTAIKRAKTKFILTMDADGQHTYEEAQRLCYVFRLTDCDMLVGERRQETRKPGRFLASAIINAIASCIAGRWVVDLNSGMRIFRRDMALGYQSILCDEFSYTTSLLMSFLADGFKVEWHPILVKDRRSGHSHVRVLKDGFVTLYYVIRIGLALRSRGLRKWLRSIKQ